jgi:hypothetical protein
MIYDIEITDFAPDARTSRTVVSTVEEAWATTRAAEAVDPCLLLVGRHEEDISYGDLHIWLAGDRAVVRLDEHREWYAMDDAHAASAAAGDTWFRDSEGTSFPAQNAETISRSHAFTALDYWLRTGGMLPSLTWT